MIPNLLQLYKGSYKFYNRVRAEGKTVANYVASLRAIAKYCDYGDTLNMIDAQRSFGMWNQPPS